MGEFGAVSRFVLATLAGSDLATELRFDETTGEKSRVFRMFG